MRASWVPGADGSLFPVENLPYGVFSTNDNDARRIGVAIGDVVLDAAAVLPEPALRAPTLNPLLATGSRVWRRTREALVGLLSDPAQRARVSPHLLPQADVTMHLPFEVADYVDFYSSEHHAVNVGRIFRPSAPALPTSWKHLPIGYHGRAGTVLVSGTPIPRPHGQRRSSGDTPAFGPSQKLDIEAEVGFVVGVGSEHGHPVTPDAFAEHVFGVVLVNDWSARDIQSWETVPLGPFLGKSFATSVSAWVVPLDALRSARLPAPAQSPEPFPHLRDVDGWGLDISLEIVWNGVTVSRPPFREMYWTAAQQLAHLTSNGASLRTGDLFASGTVSGSAPDQRGSLLELTWDGDEPATVAGQTRTYLQDGDTISLRATAPGPDGTTIGFGCVTGTIVPSPTAWELAPAVGLAAPEPANTSGRRGVRRRRG